MNKKERVMIFIDGANVYHLVKASYGEYTEKGNKKIPIFDYRKFCDLLAGENRRLIESHFYIVPVNQAENPDGYAAQQRFFSRLKEIPYFSSHYGRLVNREREIHCLNCNKKFMHKYKIEKGVDVALAVHMVTFAYDDLYDTAILVSDDGDFVTAVEEVRRLRKKVINATLPQNRKHVLARSCGWGNFISINKDFIDKCLLNIKTYKS
jgi:uncharacterized LabA/DUF88 family protein